MTMALLDLVRLREVMEITRGTPEIAIGLIDGPVAGSHPGLSGAKLRKLRPENKTCCPVRDPACRHGTFVAEMLCGGPLSGALSICPGCTLLTRPIFNGSGRAGGVPQAEPEELAAAMAECVHAGASVLNLSISLGPSSSQGEKALEEALDYVTRQGVLIVAAAGNEGTIYSSAITRHPWVIPVTACDLAGQTLGISNLSPSLGRRGLSAPGDHITGLGPTGKLLILSGTSFAVPFVTGTIALLWSIFPHVSATDIKLALALQTVRRATIVAPLLNAGAAYSTLLAKPMRRSA